MSFEQDSVPASGKPTMPVVVIALAAGVFVYFLCFYDWKQGNVANAPTVAAPAAVEKVTPAPFVTPPQSTLPAQTTTPAAAPAAQDAPHPPRRPATSTGKKRPRRH